MSQADYQRVDLDRVAPHAPQPSNLPPGEKAQAAPAFLLRWWIVIPLSLILCALQALITVKATNTATGIYVTSTLVSVAAFGFFVILLLVVNPLMDLLLRGTVHRLSRAELTAVIAALLVSAGVSTFGLNDQLVPLIATPHNPEWNVEQAGWEQKLIPQLNSHLYITDADAVKEFRQGFGEEPGELAPTSEWVAHYRATFDRIPWTTWLWPLFYWSIFVIAAYAMFYSLTYLVLDYWSRREKLIFPLAKLPESLLPESDDDRHWVPPIFRTPGFWTGFALSFLVLSYNAAIQAELLPGMNAIKLGMGEPAVTTLLRGSYFYGYSGELQFLFIFTAIGIAFLLPLEISFSIWFYYLVGRTILFIGVRMGYGANTKSFGTDWLWEQNAVTAQAAGALLLFSAINLVRCIYQIASQARKRVYRSKFDVVKSILPILGLLVSLGVMTAWITWNSVPFHWALIFSIFLALITLGLMRIVAEGGIYWFQADASFFHLWKMLGISSLTPMTLGPLLPIYSVLFLDIKTFMAPSLINAAKMRQDVGGNRAIFHINILLSLIVSIGLAIGYSLILAYSRGAQRMNSWFYSGGPKSTIDTAANATTRTPEFELGTFSWFTFGMIWVAISMFIRRTVFWFPHPIGYIMLVNNLGAQLWFSFFIGWVLKKMIVQYGGKTTYDKARNVLIGLILGELIAICVYTGVALTTGSKVRIDLNRYGP